MCRRGHDCMVVGFTATYTISVSPLMLWIWISIRTRCTTLCDKVCQWLATSRWFSPGPLVSSTNKTDHKDIAEILLKVALNTIEETNFPIFICWPKDTIDNILSTSLLIFKIRWSSVVWNKLVCVIIFCSTCGYADPMIVFPFYAPVSRRAVLCDLVSAQLLLFCVSNLYQSWPHDSPVEGQEPYLLWGH